MEARPKQQYSISSVIRFLPKNPYNLDPSYKTDLDFVIVLEEKNYLIANLYI